MEIKLSVGSNYLSAVTSGEFDLESAKERFNELMEIVEQNRVHKVFFDGLAIKGDPMVIERFYYGEFVAEAVNGLLLRGWDGPTPRFAYVLREPVLDPYRLGETVAVNRGVDMKAFDNYDEAYAWLGITPEPSPAPV